MDDFVRDMWGGPGHLRFYLQPLLAIVVGLHFGVADAKDGRPPFLLTLVMGRVPRKTLVRELVRHLRIPLILALAFDCVLQLVIRGSWRPLASVIYATLFVAFPYAATRALTNRAVRHRPHRPA